MDTKFKPGDFTWTGEAFVPAYSGVLKNTQDALGQGETIRLARHEERSQASHGHEFAVIRDYWDTLPEYLSEMPWAQTPETLRKHALIKCKYCNVEVVAAGNRAAAERVAAFILPLEKQIHGYAIASVVGTSVQVITPHSQSKKAMGPAVFQQSKTAVLEWIEGVLQGEAA